MQALAAAHLTIAVSAAILLEYEEIVTARARAAQWKRFATVLDLSAQLHGNVRQVEPSFHFHLIAADPDDDKFSNWAIAAEADFLVTDDAHFYALRGAGYKPQPITPSEFIAGFLTR